MSRIIITEKGRGLQDELLRETGTDFSELKSARSGFFEKDPFHVTLSSGSYSCRSGYFRSKEPTHLILKTDSTHRLYPNYLKRDPREYPSKHQCVWTPKSTVTTSRSVAPAFPVAKEIHHTLFHTHNDELPDNLQIRESNAIIGGRDRSFGAMNLTTCNYPTYKGELPRTKLASPASTAGSAVFDVGRRSGSDASVLHSPKTSMNFRLPMDKLNNHSRIDTEISTNRILTTSPSQILQTTYVSGISSPWKTQRYTIKGSKEKIEQISRKVQEKEDDYNKLLDRLDKTTKDRLYKQLENPDYLPNFDTDLKKGGELLDRLQTDEDKEQKRFKNRIKELGHSKYEKAWKRWDKSATKPKSKPTTSIAARTESVFTTEERTERRSVYSYASSAYPAHSDEIAQLSPASRGNISRNASRGNQLFTKTSLHC